MSTLHRAISAAVTVRGNPTAAELAALLAAVRSPSVPAATDPYRHWRDTRRAALHGVVPHLPPDS